MHSCIKQVIVLYHWPMNSEHRTIRCCNSIPLSNLILHKNTIIFNNISKPYTITFYVYTFVELQQPELVERGLELVRGGLEGSLFTVITLASCKHSITTIAWIVTFLNGYRCCTFAFSSFSPISVAPFSPHLTFTSW